MTVSLQTVFFRNMKSMFARMERQFRQDTRNFSKLKLVKLPLRLLQDFTYYLYEHFFDKKWKSLCESDSVEKFVSEYLREIDCEID
jgi:hypothetical protein